MKIPIGISDFKEILEEGYYYVDKTLLIEGLKHTNGKVIFIARPRRFGKTLNLSMLKYFYEKSTVGNKHLFEHTAIWKQPAYRAIQGTFPVIFLTFKSCKDRTWDKVYDDMKYVITHEYRRHFESLEHSLLRHELDDYNSIMRNAASPTLYTKSLCEILQEFILKNMSSFDIPDNEPERSYHMFVLGLLVVLSDTFEVKSNKESGYGRYDILLIPHDKKKHGIIIEFKKVSTASEETLAQGAQKALDQINTKNYVQELRDQSVKNSVAFGIRCKGKQIVLKSSILA